jgi:hypothetical protein
MMQVRNKDLQVSPLLHLRCFLMEILNLIPADGGLQPVNDAGVIPVVF